MPWLEPVRFGGIRSGGWCDRCLLPSILTQVLVGLLGNTEVGRFEFRWCDECDFEEEVQVSGQPVPMLYRRRSS